MVVVYINVVVVVVYVVMLHCGNRWCRIWWTMRGRMCKDWRWGLHMKHTLAWSTASLLLSSHRPYSWRTWIPFERLMCESLLEPTPVAVLCASSVKWLRNSLLHAGVILKCDSIKWLNVAENWSVELDILATKTVFSNRGFTYAEEGLCDQSIQFDSSVVRCAR